MNRRQFFRALGTIAVASQLPSLPVPPKLYSVGPSLLREVYAHEIDWSFPITYRNIPIVTNRYFPVDTVMMLNPYPCQTKYMSVLPSSRDPEENRAEEKET